MPAESSNPAPANGASRWTVAICALIGLGLSLIVFTVRTPTYEADAIIAVSNPVGLLADEVAVVTSPGVLNAAASALGFTPDVEVKSTQVAGLLTVTARSNEPERAAAAANVVAETYVQAQLGAAANVAQNADVPSDPTGLGAPVFAAIGTALGAIVGAIVSYLQSLRPTDAARNAPPNPPRPRTVQMPQPNPDLLSDRAGGDLMPAAPPDIPVPASVPPPADALPTISVDPLTAQPSSFSDASTPPTNASQPAWLTAGDDLRKLDDLDRRALQKQLETARYELALSLDEELAKQATNHERQTAALRAEVANLNKQVRMQTVRLKNRSGGDQTRVGDLEAQVDALELELSAIRQTLESERIAHTKRLTDERGTADRALDNARRQYREELAKHTHTNRQALAEHRVDLDNELASDRVNHEAALESQHQKYELQLEAERERLSAKQLAVNERYERDLAALREANKEALHRQAAQHKSTIASLRGAGDTNESHLRELEKENRMLRVEITSLQKQAQHIETDTEADIRRLTDEVALMKAELDGEHQRNAALRSDVLRRSAEAHQAVDRAVEERTAQLAELEASVARQRQYADTRVREMSAAAEEQARQSATREASLTATVSRLKRELEELKNARSRD